MSFGVRLHAVEQELVDIFRGERRVHVHQGHGNYGREPPRGFVVARKHGRGEATGTLEIVERLP